MSIPAQGVHPENKSTKRQNSETGLLSFCRLSIGVGAPRKALGAPARSTRGWGSKSSPIHPAGPLPYPEMCARRFRGRGGCAMTPESTIGGFALLDHFALMVRHLAAEPAPAPPALPGRRCRPLADPPGDALAVQWDAAR